MLFGMDLGPIIGVLFGMGVIKLLCDLNCNELND